MKTAYDELVRYRERRNRVFLEKVVDGSRHSLVFESRLLVFVFVLVLVLLFGFPFCSTPSAFVNRVVVYIASITVFGTVAVRVAPVSCSVSVGLLRARIVRG